MMNGPRTLASFRTVLAAANPRRKRSPVSFAVMRSFASDKDEFEASRANMNINQSALVSKELFEEVQVKNARTFKQAIDLFVNRDVRRRGSVEFILAALKHMKEFEVHQNLEVYKALIDVMPKEKYVHKNMWQAHAMYYLKQQDCIVDVLEEMQLSKIIPDEEVGDLITSIFGIHSSPYRKYLRMVYWMPKFKNWSPYPLPVVVPRDPRLLAEMAVQRIIAADPLSDIAVYDAGRDLADSAIDKTWIVSGQSPEQKEMVKQLPKDKAIYVEGGFRIWLRNAQVTYFVLRGEPALRDRSGPNYKTDVDNVSDFKLWMYGEKDPRFDRALPEPNVHEQEDGTILAVAATGTSSRDSLLSWVRFLQRDNPDLENIPILFTLQSPLGPVVPLTEQEMGTGAAMTR